MDKVSMDKFISRMSEVAGLGDNFYKSLLAGTNKVYHKVSSKAVTLDDEWVSTVEGTLFSIEKIAKNPRKFISEEELIVDVERARKTSAKTIRHLSTHSQNVQNISASGEVRPKKVLTTEMQEDIAIYENRFVCTLVHRLITFVEQRYEELKEKSDVYEVTDTRMTSTFRCGDSEFACDIAVRVKNPPADRERVEMARDLMERVENLRLRLRVLQGSDFMKKLDAAKPVRPPIMKTNLLKMNVEYSNCYKLWLYLSSYSFVGYSVDVQDKNLPVSGDYYDDMTVIAGLSVQAMLADNIINKDSYADIDFGDPKKKDFKLVTGYKFEPTFNDIGDDSAPAGEGAVNEFYFSKMRDELVRATKRGSKVTDEKVIQMNFRRFFKEITKINDGMYADVIDAQIPEPEIKEGNTAIQKSDADVKKASFVYRRYCQLSKLKREELENALRAESRALIALEKAKAEGDKVRGKRKDKLEVNRKKKEKLQKIKEKQKLAAANAKKYEDELRQKDMQKAESAEEAKRRKREEAQRRRDLKKLQELKEKYEQE